MNPNERDNHMNTTRRHSGLLEEATFYPEFAEGPANGMAYWIHADDKVRLRVGLWKAEKARKGTVLLFPGRSEYIENHGRTAAELDKCGYATFVIDWRGHGLSDRLTDDSMTGHVSRFYDYQSDVAAMINAAEELSLPKPWYLIGHSMGANIGLRAVIEGLPVAACAFTAPMWDIKMSPIERVAAWPLSWAAQAIGKGHIYVPGFNRKPYVLSKSFQDNNMTHDPDMYQYWVNQAQTKSDLPTGGPSMGWFFEALKECRSLSTVCSPDIPCIAFCGDKDETVDVRAIQERMAHWPGGSFELIQEAKHELLLEVPDIRENVMAKICELFTAAGIENRS